MVNTECILSAPYLVPLNTVEAAALNAHPTQYTRALIKVRSMGGATTIRIGTADIQEVTLTADGDTIPLQAPPRRYYDLNKVFAIADGDDAVLEVWGTIL